MAHLYKTSIWKGSSGKWYCADIEDLAHGSSVWYVPCRMLGISPAEWINFLTIRFNLSRASLNKDKTFLHFSWDKEADANRYKNWINAEARKRKYYI